MQAIRVRFPGGETPNFHIVWPLSKSNGGETEELILLFGWLERLSFGLLQDVKNVVGCGNAWDP